MFYLFNIWENGRGDAIVKFLKKFSSFFIELRKAEIFSEAAIILFVFYTLF